MKVIDSGMVLSTLTETEIVSKAFAFYRGNATKNALIKTDAEQAMRCNEAYIIIEINQCSIRDIACIAFDEIKKHSINRIGRLFVHQVS